LLDIGCGTGGFAHQLSLKGAWRAACVDIHPGALDVARRQGVPAWCGDAATVCLPSASFDVVTMWEVIEHIPAPRQALCEAHRILKPGGRLLLSTPNALSWQARLWGEHWAGWEVPRHLQLFSLPTLRRMLQETGFEIVRRLSFPAERFCAVASARRWLNEQGDGAPWRVSRLVGVAGWAVWPALRLIDCTPWASSIVLEAARA
jgi:2-polyprenyl-3-methyl-5-hydroxy-6-metoxy-1,4-benzoquinol methylase